MPTITVKNIPTELYELLKQSAATNRRSINSEIITCIERAVRGRKVNPEILIERARRLRLKTKDHPVTDNDLANWKQVGRP
jgi:antitoxin FitA